MFPRTLYNNRILLLQGSQQDLQDAHSARRLCVKIGMGKFCRKRNRKNTAKRQYTQLLILTVR